MDDKIYIFSPKHRRYALALDQGKPSKIDFVSLLIEDKWNVCIICVCIRSQIVYGGVYFITIPMNPFTA